MTDLERAQRDQIAPWTNVLRDEEYYVVFRDAYPVTPGHLLFVPKRNSLDYIQDCFRDAMELGEFLIESGDCDAYNLGINRGLAAGQTVMYPHVHLIPRRNNDCEDPTGGIRGVIPIQQNYKKPGYTLPQDK